MNTQTLHGNFMRIEQLGVFITGENDIGKSELALALLDRGHQLISDDVVDFHREDQKIIGCCPTLIHNFLNVSGIGMVNVEKLFEKKAITSNHPLQLIIRLVQPDNMPPIENPLSPYLQEKDILGITIPAITFPVFPAKSLPLLIEVLVKNHQLKCAGYNAAADFAKRHEKARGTPNAT